MGSRRRSLAILVFVLGLVIASGIVISQRETKLGLDLSGGTQLVYQGQPSPQNPDPGVEDIDRAIEIIRERVDNLGVAEPEISRVGADQVQVDLPNVQNAERAIDQVGQTAQLELYDLEPNVVPINQEGEEGRGEVTPQNLERQLQTQLFNAVKVASQQESECRQGNCTTNGPTFYLFDRESKQPVAGPEQERADLFLSEEAEALPKDRRQVLSVPQGTIVVSDQQGGGHADADAAEDAPPRYFVLRDRPALSGTDIEDPQQNFDPTSNQPNVTFDFTGEGEDKFQEVTAAIAERGRSAAAQAGGIGLSSNDASGLSGSFAIVLDGEIESRPIINFVDNPAGIDGRTGAQISGGFDIQEAQDLANILRIGALPVNLNLISRSTVSATLGQQALDQGLLAGGVGLVLVLLFLLAFYRFLGVIAALGLLIYGTFFYALIELIPVTLTLPGIAGLILTIGVAADSNIVIFERIKEEVRGGKSLTSAIATGYKRGISAIIDANVITLLTAFILFVLATAGVKGFAFMLGVGTLVSLFTAVVFTSALLGSLGRARFLSSPQLLGAGEQRARWRLDFAAASKWFFSISGAILAIGAISFATQQLNFGIDFESGTRIKTSLEQPASVEEVRSALADAGVPNSDAAEIQQATDEEFGPNVVQISTSTLQPDGVDQVRTTLDREFGLSSEDAFDDSSVGPTFGAQVARSAAWALAFSILLISAYVAFRFDAKYAIPVLLAVIHDILITGGVYSLSGREVTSGTVAAFLTILGYSLYDSIIVFDRIRENVPRLPRAAFSQIANRSLSEVLTRSLATSFSTLVPITMILLFGGETLRDFAFAMMIGVFSGTYSSIFIATPVLIAWKEREHSYRVRRHRILESMGRVPAFPEDNVVARVEEAEEAVVEPPERVPAAVEAGEVGPEEGPAEAAEPPEPPYAGAGAGDGSEGEGDGSEPNQAEDEELIGAGAGSRGERRPNGKRKPRRQQRRRRKHGRHR